MGLFVRGSFVLLFSLACVANGQQPVTVDESAIRAFLNRGSTAISVPLRNLTRQAIAANLTVEWLASDDRAVASESREVSIPPGEAQVEIPLSLPQSNPWLRLRYRLEPAAVNPGGFTPISGFAALTQIAGFVFETRLTYGGLCKPGTSCSVFAQAVHPVTHTAVDGVTWHPELDLNRNVTAPSRTVKHEGGVTEFVFTLPEALNDAQARVKLTGVAGDYRSSASAWLHYNSSVSARIQTDKPIYQPGQTIHARAVLLDPAGRAAPGVRAKLEIEDKDHDTVHEADLVSSKFGVVSAGWTLPASAGLGQYSLKLSVEERGVTARHEVKVSRYELPVFAVEVKPERGAFLIGETAKVAVSVKYLFGKAVPGAMVRVNEDDDDEPAAEGIAGADGVFVAHLEPGELGEYERY